METKIIIVRHGQSQANANGIYAGQTDIPLTELGISQAKSTANAIKDIKIDKIYSSDLIRAHQTALPHAELRGLSVTDSKELREMFLGDFECLPLDLLKTEHLEDFKIPWYEHFGRYKFPNGESVLGASERFYNEVMRIARENIGKTVLIASHAAVIRGFWCKISGYAPDEYSERSVFPTNASYSTLHYDGEKPIPDEYSIDSHINTVTSVE